MTWSAKESYLRAPSLLNRNREGGGPHAPVPKNTKPKKISITLPVNCDRAQFLKKLQQEGRRKWDALHGEGAKPKGGRPSLQRKIWAICDEVWREWSKAWPEGKKTQAGFCCEVSERYEAEYNRDGTKRFLDDGTIKTHVKEWMGWHLGFDEVPCSLLEHEFLDPPETLIQLGAFACAVNRLQRIFTEADEQEAMKQFLEQEHLPFNVKLKNFPHDAFGHFLEKKFPHLLVESKIEKEQSISLEKLQSHFFRLPASQKKATIKKLARRLT